MTKGAYESLPVRNEKETPSTGGRGNRSSLYYTLLSLFLFIIMSIFIYYLPENKTSILFSETEDPTVLPTEESHEPTAFPSPTVLDPVQTYVGPTLPEVVRSCPSVEYYQGLRNNLDSMNLCDDIGRKRKCLCQNPTIPRKQDVNYRYYKKWNKAFRRNVDMAQRYNDSQALDVLLLGDSLTEHWLGTDLGGRNHDYDGVRQVYRHYFQEGTIRGLALGISGDRIPHLLHRMEEGELVTTAKIIWINIGTNDLGGDHCNVDAVVAGNIAVVEYVLNAVDSSKTKVVLNSLLPRSGRNASDTNLMEDRNWQEALRINKYLECYSEMRASSALEFFDATGLFVTQDSSDYRNATLYQDSIHLSSEGYRIWGKAIVQRVEKIK
jgi:lysophospholipase L1-like esterase